MQPKISFFLIAFIFSLNSPSFAQWTWSKDTGWVNPKYSSKSSAKNLFLKAEKLFKAKKYEEALEILTNLREKYPASKYSEDILFYQAECFYHSKQLNKAHETFYTYFLDYPNTKRLPKIVEREYEIGTAFLEGEKSDVLGMKLLDAREEGIRILKSLIRIYPHSELSDDAQYKIANYFFSVDDFDEAEKEYQELLDKYLLSKWRPASAFQIAITYRKRHRGTDYDNKWLVKAAKGFRRFLKDYPEYQKVPEAKKILKDCIHLLAKKLYETANFYEITGSDRAAIRYYKLIEKRYPESDFAAKASKAIKGLKS